MADRIDHAIRARIIELRAQQLQTREIAKLLSRSVQAILAMELRMGTLRRKRGVRPNPEIAKRNEDIYRLLKEGYSYDALAERFGLSRETIKFIRHQQLRKEQLNSSVQQNT